ncbi:MAG: hypothetical protein WCY16_12555, partial [Weeksellaceae bacterium]
PTDKFEKPEDIDEKWDCSSLTGFNTYGSMGGAFDYDYSNARPYHDPIQDVNRTDPHKDTIDFNQ